MHPILIFRHVENEGPGYLAEFLDSRRVPCRLICIDQGAQVPDSLDNISALVFMGGPMSVNDPLPWIAEELALIRQAQQHGLPMLGHCLGGQLISKALGGEITACPTREIGWYPVRQIQGEAATLWLDKQEKEFEVFHWHGETFSVPEGGNAILSSEHCENQAFVMGRTLAMQCHVEVTAKMLAEWTDLFAEQLLSPSCSVQSASEILQDVQVKTSRLQAIAGRIYDHWLRGFP